jgi:alginate O-acetyltransferase complex protein AlgJ
MRVFCVLALLCSLESNLAAADSGDAPLTDAQQKFHAAIAEKFQTAEKSNAHVIKGVEDWLFVPAELRFLSAGRFWGNEAIKINRSNKPEEADPIPAILGFRDQLKQRGIELLLAPVPPKAAIYPEKIVPEVTLNRNDSAPYLQRFCDELRGKGVEIVDLMELFSRRRDRERGPVFCKTDTHWSGSGCVLAAQAMAEKVRTRLGPQPRHDYIAYWKQIEFAGDLTSLLAGDAAKSAPEKTFVRVISDKSGGGLIQPDKDSPLLVLGDSYTLVYHDFLAQGAGLIDQLTDELGFAPDLIGTRGSGATAVRVSLYRRSLKDPQYLARKKMIIWCFAAREFTEADAWTRLPISK